VPPHQRPDYHKWVRFYFHFCAKYGHSPASHLLTRRTDSEAVRNLPDTTTGLFLEEIRFIRKVCT
jgi:hypothetical protein